MTNHGHARASGSAFPSPLVCVVDDDLSILRALRRMLGACGYDVETFASAEEFLCRPVHADIACLVLDVHLGGLDGFALQERLAEAGVRVPFVMITARDDVAARDRARLAGAADYLCKPFDDAVLLAAIQRAVAAP